MQTVLSSATLLMLKDVTNKWKQNLLVTRQDCKAPSFGSLLQLLYLYYLLIFDRAVLSSTGTWYLMMADGNPASRKPDLKAKCDGAREKEIKVP